MERKHTSKQTNKQALHLNNKPNKQTSQISNQSNKPNKQTNRTSQTNTQTNTNKQSQTNKNNSTTRPTTQTHKTSQTNKQTYQNSSLLVRVTGEIFIHGLWYTRDNKNQGQGPWGSYIGVSVVLSDFPVVFSWQLRISESDLSLAF